MTDKKKRSFGVIAILEYVFVVLVILSGNSMYPFMSLPHISISNFMKLSAAVAVAIFFLSLIKYGKLKFKPNTLVVILLFLLHNVVYMIMSRYNTSGFFVNYVMVLYAYVLLCITLQNRKYGYREIVEKYCNIMIVVAGFSLVCYVFGTMLNLLPGASTIRYSKMGLDFSCRSYYGLYFEAQDQVLMGRTFIRNCGIFLEAPGFALPLCFTLLYELFGKKHPRKWVCALITITGVTTFSTKVFVAMTVLYVIFFMTNQKYRGTFLKVVKMISAPVILVLGGVIIYYALMVKAQENSSSFLGRIDSLQATVKVWLHHPIFGSGFKNDDSVRAYYTYIKSKYNGITAGFTCVLAQGGIWLMFQYLFSLGMLYRSTAWEDKKLVKVFLLIFIIFWVQSSIQFNPITYFIVAMGLVQPIYLKTATSSLLRLLGKWERV